MYIGTARSTAGDKRPGWRLRPCAQASRRRPFCCAAVVGRPCAAVPPSSAPRLDLSLRSNANFPVSTTSGQHYAQRPHEGVQVITLHAMVLFKLDKGVLLNTTQCSPDLLGVHGSGSRAGQAHLQRNSVSSISQRALHLCRALLLSTGIQWQPCAATQKLAVAGRKVSKHMWV